MKYVTKIGDITNVPSTIEYDVSYENAWAEGTGRNALDGSFIGTFIGIFPKLIIKFAPLPESEEAALLKACRKPSLSITWWDKSKRIYRTDNFYPDPVQSGVLLSHKNIGKPLTLVFTAEKRDKV